MQVQLHRVVGFQRRGIGCVVGEVEAGQRVDRFRLKLQSFTARCQHLDARRRAEDVGDQRRAVQNMFEVVGDQQHALLTQIIEKLRFRVTFCGELETECVRNCREQRLGGQQRRQLDQQDAVGEHARRGRAVTLQQAAGDAQREACLAHATRADNGDQARARVEQHLR